MEAAIGILIGMMAGVVFVGFMWLITAGDAHCKSFEEGYRAGQKKERDDQKYRMMFDSDYRRMF